jgi:hypothetical protein
MIELSSDKIILIADFVEKYIQSCFDVEYQFQNSLKSIKKITELSKVNFDLSWPSTVIK